MVLSYDLHRQNEQFFVVTFPSGTVPLIRDLIAEEGRLQLDHVRHIVLFVVEKHVPPVQKHVRAGQEGLLPHLGLNKKINF